MAHNAYACVAGEVLITVMVTDANDGAIAF